MSAARAAHAARATSAAGTAGDEGVRAPGLHECPKLRERWARIGAVEAAEAHHGVAGRELVAGGRPGAHCGRDPIQGNARGAAWVEHVFGPQAGGRAVYDERYRTFLEIHKRMRPLFRRVNKGAQ